MATGSPPTSGARRGCDPGPPAPPARALPSATRTRLIVEPAQRVTASVLPAEEPGRAEAVSLVCGIPERVLRRNGARVRQTHRRANVVVLEVAPGRQDALRADLAAAGF